MLDLLKQLPDWLQAIVILLGALSTLATALHGVFAIIATKVPSAIGAADFFGTWGVHLKAAAGYLGALLDKMKGSAGKASAAILLCGALALGAAEQGCKPSQIGPELSQVEQDVLRGIVSGETAEQIEEDVAKDLAGQPGADAVILVNDAIAILRDLRVIPAGALQHSDSVSMRVHEQLAGRHK